MTSLEDDMKKLQLHTGTKNKHQNDNLVILYFGDKELISIC